VPEETMVAAFPYGYNKVEELCPGFWSDMKQLASDMNGAISHHCRKSMANMVGGHSKYKLTLMGKYAPELWQAVKLKLEPCGLGLVCCEPLQWCVRPPGDIVRLSRQAGEPDQAPIEDSELRAPHLDIRKTPLPFSNDNP
jgi:hypothetical protein